MFKPRLHFSYNRAGAQSRLSWISAAVLFIGGFCSSSFGQNSLEQTLIINSTHHLPSSSGTFFGVDGLFLTANGSVLAEQNFDIYQLNGSTIRHVTRYGGQVDVNRAGNLAINGYGRSNLCLATPAGVTQLVANGFSTSGGNDGDFTWLGHPAINDSNVIAFPARTTQSGGGIFVASLVGGAPQVRRIAVVGQDSKDGGVFSQFDQYNQVVSIGQTATGEVLTAFNATTSGSLGGGLYLGTPTAITRVANSSYYNVGNMNDVGQMVLVRDSDYAICVATMAGVTPVVNIGDLAPDGLGFTGLSEPAINDAGDIVFIGIQEYANAGVYRKTADGITLIAQEGVARGGGEFYSFSNPYLNNAGDVVFSASVRYGVNYKQGLFLGKGTDLYKVIEVGDNLEGSVVAGQLSFRASSRPGTGEFNEHSQVAYSVQLTNNQTVVCRYTPGLHWRLNTDGSWDAAANWTTGAVPAVGANAIIDPDSTVNVAGPGSATTIQGLQIGGGGGTTTFVLPAGSGLAVKGSTIIAANGAMQSAATLTGNVTCLGAISTGPAIGQAQFKGNLNLQSDAQISLKIGGAGTAGVDYDTLSVSGSLATAGALNVTLVNNFDPQPGDRFVLVGAHSRSGHFATTTLPPLPTGLTWITNRLAIDGSIAVSGGAFFANEAGTYAGLVGAAAPADADAGLLKLTVSQNGSFTATLTLDEINYVWHGFFDTSGHYHFDGVSGQTGAIGKTGASVDLQLDMIHQTKTLSGSIVINGVTTNVTAALPGYSKKNPATAVAGKYTVLLPPDPTHTDSTYPQGIGFATVSVSSTGVAQVAGALGDGTPFTAGGLVSVGNDVPIYLTLYGKKGSISGALHIDPTAGNPVSGTLNWFKDAQTKGFYAQGFTGATTLWGSTYALPKDDPEVLPVGPAKFDIAGGHVVLTSSEKDLQINTGNKVSILSNEKFALVFSKSTGLFSGTFRDTVGKGWKFRGAARQLTGEGGGLFSGVSGEVGSVSLSTH